MERGKEQKQHQKTRNLVPKSQMKDLEEFITRCEANSIPDEQIDTSDCPVLTAEQLSKLRPCHLVNRKLWKPQKKVLSIRLDADVLDALRKSGKGWQTRVNDLLRQAVNGGQL